MNDVLCKQIAQKPSVYFHLLPYNEMILRKNIQINYENNCLQFAEQIVQKKLQKTRKKVLTDAL